MSEKGNFNKKGDTNVRLKDSNTILHEAQYLNDQTGVNEPGKAGWNELETMRFEDRYDSSKVNTNTAEFERRLNRSNVKLRLARLSLAA